MNKGNVIKRSASLETTTRVAIGSKSDPILPDRPPSANHPQWWTISIRQWMITPRHLSEFHQHRQPNPIQLQLRPLVLQIGTKIADSKGKIVETTNPRSKKFGTSHKRNLKFGRSPPGRPLMLRRRIHSTPEIHGTRNRCSSLSVSKTANKTDPSIPGTAGPQVAPRLVPPNNNNNSSRKTPSTPENPGRRVVPSIGDRRQRWTMVELGHPALPNAILGKNYLVTLRSTEAGHPGNRVTPSPLAICGMMEMRSHLLVSNHHH